MECRLHVQAVLAGELGQEEQMRSEITLRKKPEVNDRKRNDRDR